MQPNYRRFKNCPLHHQHTIVEQYHQIRDFAENLGLTLFRFLFLSSSSKTDPFTFTMKYFNSVSECCRLCICTMVNRLNKDDNNNNKKDRNFLFKNSLSSLRRKKLSRAKETCGLLTHLKFGVEVVCDFRKNQQQAFKTERDSHDKTATEKKS